MIGQVKLKLMDLIEMNQDFNAVFKGQKEIFFADYWVDIAKQKITNNN